MTKDDQDETRLLLEEIESFQNQFEASRGRSERTTDEYLAPGEPYQRRHWPQAKKLGRLDYSNIPSRSENGEELLGSTNQCG